jgi:hypothetical protein
MRSILIAGAALATLLAASVAASAQSSMTQNEKFCSEMKSSGSTAATPNCAYKTMAQCQEAVKAQQGTCIENPKMK